MGALQEQKPNTTVSYNPNEAHIVYASDDGFAEILGVSMVSLYENSKDMEFIAVYVLDSGIADGVKIGANAVVVKSCYNKGATLVGIPALEVRK